ncbi:hypothetical protein [Nocardia sp.]|nr:hypothetical protein [Nocardia sp.]
MTEMVFEILAFQSVSRLARPADQAAADRIAVQLDRAQHAPNISNSGAV